MGSLLSALATQVSLDKRILCFTSSRTILFSLRERSRRSRRPRDFVVQLFTMFTSFEGRIFCDDVSADTDLFSSSMNFARRSKELFLEDTLMAAFLLQLRYLIPCKMSNRCNYKTMQKWQQISVKSYINRYHNEQ